MPNALFRRVLVLALSLPALAFPVVAQNHALSIGRGSYLKAADTDDTEQADGSFTVEAWVKHDGGSDADAVILTKSDETGAIDYELSLVGAGDEVAARFTVYSAGWQVTSVNGLAAGRWTHVAGTFSDDGYLRIYLDGRFEAETYAGGNTNATDTPLTVGAAAAGNGRFFSGRLDEVRIWDVARSAEEIGRDWTATLPATTPGLVVAYPFDGEAPLAEWAGADRTPLTPYIGQITTDAPGAMPVPPDVKANWPWATPPSPGLIVVQPRTDAADRFKVYRSATPDMAGREFVASISGNDGSLNETGWALPSDAATAWYCAATLDREGREGDCSYPTRFVRYTREGGGALRLTNGGYALTPDRPSLALGSEHLSVEAWIKHDGTSETDAILLTRSDDTGMIDYELSLAGEGEEVPVRFTIYNANWEAVSRAGVPAGRWTHVAGTYDGARIRVCVDGQLSGETVSSGATADIDAPLVLGAGPDGRARRFSGWIDEVRVWDVALDSARVLQLATRQPVEVTPVVAEFRFDDLEAPAPMGQTPWPLALTLSPNAAVVPGGAFIPGGSVSARQETGGVRVVWTSRFGNGETARLYRSTRPDFSDRQLVYASDVAVAGWFDPDVAVGTDYYYQLTLVQGGIESDYSAPARVTVGARGDGNALRLDGGYATVTDRPSLDQGDESFAVEAWIRYDETSEADAVIVTKTDTDEHVDYELSLVGEGSERPARFTIYSSNWNVTSSTPIVAGTWTHLAGVYEPAGDETKLRLYINGVLDAEETSSGGSWPNDGPLVIGASYDRNGRYYTGLIDELRLWSEARTAEQVALDATVRVMGNEEHLAAAFRFDENLGERIGNEVTHGATPHPMTALLSMGASLASAGTPVATAAPVDDLPAAVVLDAAYPNPFNPATTVRFGLPAAAAVRLSVYDVTGRRVAQLLDGEMRAAGRHEVRFDAAGLPSGPYFFRLEAAGAVQHGRVVLVK